MYIRTQLFISTMLWYDPMLVFSSSLLHRSPFVRYSGSFCDIHRPVSNVILIKMLHLHQTPLMTWLISITQRCAYRIYLRIAQCFKSGVMSTQSFGIVNNRIRNLLNFAAINFKTNYLYSTLGMIDIISTTCKSPYRFCCSDTFSIQF